MEQGRIIDHEPVLVDSEIGREGPVDGLIAIQARTKAPVALTVHLWLKGGKRNVEHSELHGAHLWRQIDAPDRQRVGEGRTGQIDVDATIEVSQSVAIHVGPRS